MFLEHFGFDSIKDLPGLAELKGAGLLDSNLPPGFTIPDPHDAAALMPDEVPLGDDLVEADGASQAAEEGSTEPLAEDDEAPVEPEGNVAQFPAQAMPLLKQG
jgi:segregation and condensation protein B